MSTMKLDGNSTVPVRLMVVDSSTPVTSTNAVEVTVKDLLIAVFEAIPTQAASTATVEDIVTALKTLP